MCFKLHMLRDVLWSTPRAEITSVCYRAQPSVNLIVHASTLFMSRASKTSSYLTEEVWFGAVEVPLQMGSSTSFGCFNFPVVVWLVSEFSFLLTRDVHIAARVRRTNSSNARGWSAEGCAQAAFVWMNGISLSPAAEVVISEHVRSALRLIVEFSRRLQKRGVFVLWQVRVLKVDHLWRDRSCCLGRIEILERGLLFNSHFKCGAGLWTGRLGTCLGHGSLVTTSTIQSLSISGESG